MNESSTERERERDFDQTGTEENAGYGILLFSLY
jgi:hypothetical protein